MTALIDRIHITPAAGKKMGKYLGIFPAGLVAFAIGGIPVEEDYPLRGVGKPKIPARATKDSLWAGAGHHHSDFLCHCHAAQSQPIR